MYGGVATPLALLHQNNEISSGNSRPRTSNVVPSAIVRNAPRLPPLRETSRGESLNGGESEPLLPSASNAKIVLTRNFQNKNKIPEEDLPPPPLPPHKTNQFSSSRPHDGKYIPPWPRGVINPPPRPQKDLKPYLKPLPKPPNKRSPNMLFRIEPDKHLQRHYSDESLSGAGLYGGGVQHRIHSSADEISSLNHSPSISSSDESYSRTTDASPSPPLQPEPVNTEQWLYPSDIQVNPCSSPDTSPRVSVDYIPPQCYVPPSRSFSPPNNGRKVNPNKWVSPHKVVNSTERQQVKRNG